jgi:hypothetical protein
MRTRTIKIYWRLLVIQFVLSLSFQACDNAWKNLEYEVKPWYKYRKDGEWSTAGNNSHIESIKT